MLRDPNEEEKVVVDRVVAIATAWQAGDLKLSEARSQCRGYERFQAMRFLPRSSQERRAVSSLLDHLGYEDQDQPRYHIVEYGTEPNLTPVNIMAHDSRQPPLYMTYSELGRLGYKEVTNWADQRVWVAPLYWINDEPRYPPVGLPPGEERREAEKAMNVQYEDYRRKKKKGAS
jgi:hypothetical protein